MEDRFRARTVAAQAAPAPFWTRIPAIATYPLRGSALYALIALTLCGALLVLPGILKLVIAGVLGMATYTYAFDILRHTADGEPDAPRLGYNSFDSAVLRLILLAIALGIVIGAGAVIAGPFGLTIAYLGTMLLLPGMLISLAIDGSLRRALNPAVSIDMALRIGWPYLAAYGLLYVIQGSGTAAVFFAITYLPPLVRAATVMATSIWTLFASFHLLGYLVYQYHEELGYVPSSGEAHERRDPDQRLLDEAEQYVRDGHSDEAFQALRGAVRSRAVSLAVHELYQRLLRQHHRNDELREHTRQYINRLLQEKAGTACARAAARSAGHRRKVYAADARAGQPAGRARKDGRAVPTCHRWPAGRHRCMAARPDAACLVAGRRRAAGRALRSRRSSARRIAGRHGSLRRRSTAREAGCSTESGDDSAGVIG